ncbi:hypothetical protein LRAMOSA01440 [Lichtheimia ramosa]|uniref:Prokaryotic-type class I peptide chain release factors domain-containing protein n=1 Tax=Lichtheimia ramosa TaxID=688394 RepID=A0A077WIE2_9FUNG|nr:hypothetical protein LRAMOSA01440 [Lichtheimia ramosa]
MRFALQYLRRYSSKPWSHSKANEWINNFNKDKIPQDKLRITFSKSSGPGGQNVNKVSSKVNMRLELNQATWLPSYAKDKLKLTKAGELVITSDKTRSQANNVDDCYNKLVQTIKDAVAVPRDPDEATLARVETLKKNEKIKRKELKKRHSQKKQSRRSKGNDY